MTSEQIDKLRSLLIQACDKAMEEGRTIIAGHFTFGPTQCCPINCLIGYISHDAILELNKLLSAELVSNDIWDFIFAFDGGRNSVDYDSNPMVLLGRELRNKYIQTARIKY